MCGQTNAMTISDRNGLVKFVRWGLYVQMAPQVPNYHREPTSAWRGGAIRKPQRNKANHLPGPDQFINHYTCSYGLNLLKDSEHIGDTSRQ